MKYDPDIMILLAGTTQTETILRAMSCGTGKRKEFKSFLPLDSSIKS